MTVTALVALCVAVFTVTLALTGAVRTFLRRRAILDHPNERSSHEVPTPRGGGWGLVPVLLLGWLTAVHLGGFPLAPMAVICGLAAVLGLLSWLDDLRGLPPAVRLAGQVLAVAAALITVPLPGAVFWGGLPPSVDLLAAGVLWVWYINLFNFMDGIDGITGVETVSTGIGVAVAVLVAGFAVPLGAFGWIAAAAAAGFLVWNWQPAKIFLGDVGSVPLGFLLGWMLLWLAAVGQGAAALIIAGYYLTDATVTLVRRAARGEKVWRAHREHFYQQAVQRGASHGRVSLTILAANVALIGLAALAAHGSAVAALTRAAVLVASLLAFLRGGAGAGRRDPEE